MRYHVYVVSIQDVNDLIGQNNVTVCHTHSDDCADFFAKLGANSDIELLYHASEGEKNTGGLNCVYFFFVFSY